jgi:excisionase family DNA binding protein
VPLSTASASIQPVTNIEAHERQWDGLAPLGLHRTLRSGTPAGPEARLQGLSSFLPALLSVREAAERLRVSSATVYALRERGELRHVRVSNAIRLQVEDLEDFIRRAGR